MTSPIKKPVISIIIKCAIFCLSFVISTTNYAQDTTRSLLDINNTKLVKKVNSFLDSNQKKLNKLVGEKTDAVKNKLNNTVNKAIPTEVEKPLPYERLLNKKYTLARRAYQNTTAQFNYYFNAEEELKEIIFNARTKFQDDYTELLPFYDYDLSDIAKHSIDSIIYRCNANIVLHDLRNNWIDDAYLLMAKAYLFHKNFDTAGSILQFINYSFDEKENGADLPIGSNVRNTKGKFSIATAENNRIWENENVRNESMVWQARNYFETGAINEGISLLQLLQSDAFFPKRLYPFIHEQLAYGYYQMEAYENAATNLVQAIPNALDANAKARWYFLIAQLYDKVDKKSEAYKWYTKASGLAINPVLGVYAKINMIQYELQQGNSKWYELASSLEKLTRKDKYKPYSDIIYFEMAKLAIQNNDPTKASNWLINSIKKNSNSYKQRQKAFELLGNINYKIDRYPIAKLAYDSLAVVLKTNPLYDQILLRKKWLGQVSSNDQIMKEEDSLQYFFTLPTAQSNLAFANWTKLRKNEAANLKDIFVDKATKKDSLLEIVNNNTSFFNNNSNTAKNSNSDFYFENKNTIAQGKKSFTQKWGERPNVDNWRRKTSGNISYGKNINNQNDLSNIATNNFTKDSNSKSSYSDSSFSNTAIKDSSDLKISLTKWNKAAIVEAELFLLQLNDFEKAYPIYQKIISKNIDPTITERAMLDLASQYIHDGKQLKADSIIQIVTSTYPKGFYQSKKKEAEAKKYTSENASSDYKNAYFLTQIGDWEKLNATSLHTNANFKKSKWYTPFQFLRVKMYAQQRQDSIAIVLLDSIIYANQNELIRSKAKNIIAEIKKRKETESYLKNLRIVLPEPAPLIITEELVVSPQQKNNTSTADNKSQDSTGTKQAKESHPTATPIPAIIFTNDSLEEHYMAIVTNKVKEVFVKETQTAFNYLNEDEYKKLQLNTTYVQFDDEVYIVWIGPFANQASGIQYIQKIKPRLKKELISFIPEKQYEIYIFGKSNLLQIKSKDDLKLYQEYMLKNIIK
jgi:adenosyl cobinamide kinase/adenosyl cobinamide phosphate guanylyltransferase